MEAGDHQRFDIVVVHRFGDEEVVGQVERAAVDGAKRVDDEQLAAAGAKQRRAAVEVQLFEMLRRVEVYSSAGCEVERQGVGGSRGVGVERERSAVDVE